MRQKLKIELSKIKAKKLYKLIEYGDEDNIKLAYELAGNKYTRTYIYRNLFDDSKYKFCVNPSLLVNKTFRETFKLRNLNKTVSGTGLMFQISNTIKTKYKPLTKEDLLKVLEYFK